MLPDLPICVSQALFFMVQPPLLKPGDRVSIVAPAKVIDPERLSEGIKIIANWGFEIQLGKHIYNRDNLFAGTDSERLQDLQEAMDDPEVRAIFCARGGYGTSRIIDKLNLQHFKSNPKWVCGFSDITALNGLISNHGVMSVHTIMPAMLKKDSRVSLDSLNKFLLTGSDEIHFPAHSDNRIGEVDGEIIGGNLSMLCSCIGTFSEMDFADRILFIEEVDEYLYKLDRMINQLLRMGKLSKLRGLVIGWMTNMKNGQINFGKNAHKIISEAVEEFKYPLCFGAPIGHEEPNLAIPIGKTVHLKVSDKGTLISF